ncbi:MAG: hypothetical protein ACLP29_01935 [Dissulfurispiraceae bacterium]
MRKNILVMFFVLFFAEVVFAAAHSGPQPVVDKWPREFKLSRASLLVYQPQIDTWEGNMLNFRAVVGIKPNGSKQETFGVFWGTARTQVDKVARMVLLEDLTITKTKFPTLPDNGYAYMRALQTQLAATAKRIISLDRLEASLAASETAKPVGIPVDNTPPAILVSYKPAILIPIDGNPDWRQVPNTQFERVINTHALILRPQGSSTLYLHIYDGWLYAGTLQEPWLQPMILPPSIDQVAQSLAESDLVDLLNGGGGQPKVSLANLVPTIYVSETPAELLMFKGQPTFTPLEGTSLIWASNTANDVLFNTADNNYYVLLSGRWYHSSALTGPWTYVASTDLPADFGNIPPSSPAGIVLASVAGTSQAQEAVIANSIPQTATIPRANGPQFTPTFDGAPQFQTIGGTSLQYVVNSPAPVIQVDAYAYYALQAGVWFYATTLNGPWYVAPAVPAAIYTIPVNSPLHYVTYVRIYGATPQVVYVGYTPGYMGTVVTPDGVVVYGTGYVYQPWVGTVYYAPPVTYGVMAQPVNNPAVGVTFGFAIGVTTAAVVYGGGGTAYYHPAYYGYPCCGSASVNVYGQYGSTAYSGTRTYYSNSGGTVGTASSGTYKNYSTGTTGSYEAGRSYNTATGQVSAGYARSFNTTSGVSGGVERGATYNPQTGTATKGAAATATGPGGGTTSAEGSHSANVYGQQSAQAEHTTTNPNTGTTKTGQTTAATGSQGSGVQHQTTASNSKTGISKTSQTTAAAGSQGSGVQHQTTVSNSKTGQSKTVSHGSGSSGNTAYADHNGNVYKNSGSGWQQHTSSGWQNTSKPPSSVQNEQVARNQGEQKYNSYKQTSSSGGWGGHSGGAGGFGGRFGGGGGGGGRFGGGRR